MTGGVLLGIDAGQTAIKVRVVDGGETLLEREAPGIRTHEAVLPQIAQLVREVSAEVGGVDTVTAGVSGLTAAEHDGPALRTLIADGRVALVVLAHDSITSYLGARGAGSGVVVAAGTGVVTLAVGAERVARVDGWGHIMGDAGGGYWIGRAALDAVMRAHDGRGPATALTAPVRERWPDLEGAYIALQADARRVRVVASFAADVAALARTDAVARTISEAAAAEIAVSARTAADRVRDAVDAPLDVCAVGGVFGNDTLRERFASSIRDAALRLVPAAGDGLDGAGALGALSPGHPLLAHVSVAA